MTTYTVYMPPKDNLVKSEENFLLIPDAKATLALFFPPFWLVWYKLWLPLMFYFCVIVAIMLLAFTSPSIAVSYLSILPGLYLLLEGYELVRKNLESKGWQFAGIVEGENKEEAEIRFIADHGHIFAEIRPVVVSEQKAIMPNPGVNKNTMSLFPE
jgi:hypothetical protein